MGLEEFYTAQRQKLEKRKLQPMLLVLLGEVPVPLFAIHIENKGAKCARQNLSQNEFKFSKHFFLVLMHIWDREMLNQDDSDYN